MNEDIRAEREKEFIAKARILHHNKFDYSLVNYKTSTDKVDIICPTHGLIKVAPYTHLKGYDCRECANDKKSKDFKYTQQDVINNFIEAHGDIYDYSSTVYVNAKTKVEVICRKHGKFTILPSEHKAGRHCPECSNELLSKKKLLDQDSVIKRFKAKHGDRYDYSDVVYRGLKTHVKIKCSIHGVFEQTPQVHLTTGGCKQCGLLSRSKYKRESVNIIKQFRERHGDKYDYSHVQYKRCDKKVPVARWL